MNPANYFDIWDIFINELVGNLWLFIFIGLLAITYFCIRKGIPIQVTLMLDIFFLAIVFSQANGLIIIWALIGMIASLLFYFYIARVQRRG